MCCCRLRRRCEPEVGARGAQSGSVEEAPIPCRGPADEAFQIALDVVFGGQYLEVGDTGGEPNELRHAAANLGVTHVVQHIGANEKVEFPYQMEGFQLGEGGAADVALPSEARHGVVAGIETQITQARTEGAELRLPCSFAASDVEHGAHLTAA